MIAEKVFAEGVTKDIKNYLSPEYSQVECTVLERQKNNGVTQVGICFHNPEQKASPIIYIQPFYNMEPKVVQTLLGHSSISITLNIYTHVLDNKMDEEIRKFGMAKTEKVLKSVVPDARMRKITAYSHC